MSNQSAVDLLDGTLDDLADLPGFKMPPSGAYLLAIQHIVAKEVNSEPAVEAKFTILEVSQLDKPDTVKEENMPKRGDEFATLYMLGNDIGQGKFKDFIRPFRDKLFGEDAKVKNREVMEKSKGLEGLFVLKTKFNRDKDRDFTEIVSVILG